MRVLIYFALVFACLSCTKLVYVPVETVRTVKEVEHDTIVEVKLVRDSMVVLTRDTIARAETNVAEAKAVVSAGQLALNIRNKDVNLPVPAKIKTVFITDSIPYPVEVPVEVKVKYTPWYDKVIRWTAVVLFIMSAFGVTIFDLRKR